MSGSDEDFDFSDAEEEEDAYNPEADAGEQAGDHELNEDVDFDDDFEDEPKRKKAKTKPGKKSSSAATAKTKTPKNRKATTKKPKSKSKPQASKVKLDNSGLQNASPQKPPQKAAASKTQKTSKGTAAKRPATEVWTAQDARDKVLEYMMGANRPYSLLNVFENLHKRVQKPSLTKILDKLADAGDLKVKEFGKTKIYWYDQDKYKDCSEEAITAATKQAKVLEAESAKLTSRLAEAKNTLSCQSATPTNSQLETSVSKLENAIEEMRQQVLKARSRPPVSSSKKEELKKEYLTLRQMWTKRKRNCMDFVEEIAESMEKKTDKVCDMIGIETDKAANITIPPAIDNKRPKCN